MPSRGPLRQFLRGAGLVVRGFGQWTASPRLMLLGMLPAFVTLVVFAGLMIVLAANLGAITEWATAWAAGWDPGWRAALRVVLTLALAAGGVLLLTLSFTAVTLAIGAPFYDALAGAVDTRLGVADAIEPPFWRSLGGGIRDSLLLVLVGAASGVVLFVVGLIPVVGSVIAGVVGAVVGGWLLAHELTGVAGERRGVGLSGRRALLQRDRALSLGFGVTAFVLFLVPFGALIGMPAAVAGGTLLVRDLNGEPIGPGQASTSLRS